MNNSAITALSEVELEMLSGGYSHVNCVTMTTVVGALVGAALGAGAGAAVGAIAGSWYGEQVCR